MYSFIFGTLKRKVRTRNTRSLVATRKYMEHKEVARKIVLEKLEVYRNIYLELGYDLKYNRIAIRNTKTRWGSCSSKSNLNFNYKLALIPSHLVDYIVVHELCHLKEMNHGKGFWELVSAAIPNHTDLKRELKLINLSKI